MKKFISFVMAAAMVASMVPATAFAGDRVTATAKIIGAVKMSSDEAKESNGRYKLSSESTPAENAKIAPELVLKITGATYEGTTGKTFNQDIKLLLDNADFYGFNAFLATEDEYKDVKHTYISIKDKDNNDLYGPTSADNQVLSDARENDKDNIPYIKEVRKVGEDEIKIIVTGKFEVGDTVKIDLVSRLTTTAAGKTATVSVSGDLVSNDDLVYATIVKKGITVSIKDTVDVAQEEKVDLNSKGLKIKFTEGTFDTDKKVSLKLNKGFEFVEVAQGKDAVEFYDKNDNKFVVTNFNYDGNELTFDLPGAGAVEPTKVDKPAGAEVKASDEPKKTDAKYDLVDTASALKTKADTLKAAVGPEPVKGEGDFAPANFYAAVASGYATYADAQAAIDAGTATDLADAQADIDAADAKAADAYEDARSEYTKKYAAWDLANDEYEKALKADEIANEATLDVFEADHDAWAAAYAPWKAYNDYLAALANYKAGSGFDLKEITIKGLRIEATSAKVGAEATITVKHNNVSDSCAVAQVVDYKVKMTVDADEDIPVIYSGVNVENYGITDDSDHWSLEVTAEETFPGAWGMRKEFSMYLPDGVYVTNVEVTDTDNFLDSKTTAKNDANPVSTGDWFNAFEDAYQDGNHVTFEFPKRLFDDVDTKLTDDPAFVTFKLQLVADPTFEGDVVLTLEGELIDKNEVTVAKFVKPYTTTAQTNDMIIDYRYTDIDTDITITEAADGLWAKNEAEFQFAVEKGIEFENDADFTVTEDSGLELKSTGSKNSDVAKFTVKSESDDAATVTINNASLYMERNIPAGPYDLLLRSSLADKYVNEGLFAADKDEAKIYDVTDYTFYDADEDNAYAVKEAFVNVITSGRDTDDASFTTKVVVPVGEKYLIAGDKQIELDVPAYITAAGYTMLPVRAVANALGINSDAVMWNGDARTVTIFYGQRIITMTIGQKVVNVNGSAIPASAEVEITDGRTFLPMRDLATALGVTDITWDSASKTATLNGNQVTAK